jgi:hypothetical protein
VNVGPDPFGSLEALLVIAETGLYVLMYRASPYIVALISFTFCRRFIFNLSQMTTADVKVGELVLAFFLP